MEKLEQYKKQIPKKIDFGENISISKISINQYYSLKNIIIENIFNKKEIYFVGENGVGKTILLQSILLSLKQKANKELSFLKIFQENWNLESYYSSKNLLYKNTHPNIFAYGVGRFRAHDYEIDKTGYGTLFDNQNINLKNPVQWLKDILLYELDKTGSLKHKDVINLLEQILNIEETSDISIIKEENNKTNFVFKEQGTEVSFSQLADGYRSVLLILSDLIMRLSENQPDITNISEFRGIVLIDEIDMLLHPKWEYKIVGQLRKKLPNIQWFFTTHSPTLIMGASEDAVFYKMYKEKGISKISEQWTNNDIKHLMASSLVTSPLFGLESASMSSLKNVAQLDK